MRFFSQRVMSEMGLPNNYSTNQFVVRRSLFQHYSFPGEVKRPSGARAGSGLRQAEQVLAAITTALLLLHYGFSAKGYSPIALSIKWKRRTGVRSERPHAYLSPAPLHRMERGTGVRSDFGFPIVTRHVAITANLRAQTVSGGKSIEIASAPECCITAPSDPGGLRGSTTEDLKAIDPEAAAKADAK